MNRIEFTEKLAALLTKMMWEGEFPILDYVKRSDAEQLRLFDLGLSKCDGTLKVSQHQSGRAADIYFVANGKLGEPVKGWEYWHEFWELWGGKPMIDWDKGHFE